MGGGFTSALGHNRSWSALRFVGGRAHCPSGHALILAEQAVRYPVVFHLQSRDGCNCFCFDGRSHLRGSAQSNAGPSFRSGEALNAAVGVQRPFPGPTSMKPVFALISPSENRSSNLAAGNRELAPIRVNDRLTPGGERTPLWSPMSDADRDTLDEQTADRLPVGHVGEGAEISDAYLYLMRQSYSTGPEIR